MLSRRLEVNRGIAQLSGEGAENNMGEQMTGIPEIRCHK